MEVKSLTDTCQQVSLVDYDGVGQIPASPEDTTENKGMRNDLESIIKPYHGITDQGYKELEEKNDPELVQLAFVTVCSYGKKSRWELIRLIYIMMKINGLNRLGYSNKWSKFFEVLNTGKSDKTLYTYIPIANVAFLIGVDPVPEVEDKLLELVNADQPKHVVECWKIVCNQEDTSVEAIRKVLTEKNWTNKNNGKAINTILKGLCKRSQNELKSNLAFLEILTENFEGNRQFMKLSVEDMSTLIVSIKNLIND